MGAGKSAVGARLAERLGLAFADADARIEAEAGLSVAEIFEREGEPGFRKREREVVLGLAGEGGVVALGGGALTQPAVAAAVAGGTLLYLRARPETLAARVDGVDGQGDRPLLHGLDPAGRQARLHDLLEVRSEAYERADLIIDTDGRSLAEVVDATVAALEKGS